MKRYLAEFDFRCNERMALGVNDAERASKAVVGIAGKRLLYQDTKEATTPKQKAKTLFINRQTYGLVPIKLSQPQ